MSKTRKYSPHFIVVSCYTLLTLLLTYPVASQLTSHVAGFEGEDNLQWRWFLWWFKHALLTLQSSTTDLVLLYAPLKSEQALYAITTVVPATALPFTLLAGPTVSFNLSLLSSFILSGYTAYLLAYYLTRHHLAGFVAGLIFAFYPARFGYATGTFLGQLNVYLLPIYLLGLLMLTQRPTIIRAVWVAVSASLLCLTWPLHVAYGVIVFTLAMLIKQSLQWFRYPQKRHQINYFLLAFALIFTLLIGFYFPLIQTVLQGQNDHLGDSDSVNFALDGLAFVTPSNYHPLLKSFGWLPYYATRVLADRDDIHERLAYLGFIPFLLLLVGLIKVRHQLKMWLYVALSTMILSLGPLLKFNGDLVRLNVDGYVGYVILPYAFLRSLPIFDWSKTLGRLTVPTMLCLAIMAAYGVSYLTRNIKSQTRQTVVVALLSIFILVEYATIFPFPTDSAIVPDFYYQLKREAETTPQQIIDLPLTGEPSYTNISMHYQTVHHQPIAGGHFMRKPAGAAEMRLFLNTLLSPPLEQALFTSPDYQTRLALLQQFGFTKIVSRNWLMTSETSQAQLTYLSELLGQPDLQDADGITVFDIPSAEQARRLSATVLLHGGGWQATEAELHLVSPSDLLVYSDQDSTQQLTLSIAAPQPDRYLSIDVNGRPTARLFLAPETLTYHVPLTLTSGAHQLTFRPEESCLQACAPVDFRQLRLVEREAFTQSISFGEKIKLLKQPVSTQMVSPGQPLLTYLYWQSVTVIEADYSAFVHLLDADGELVAQADYLLGGWLYPTSTWPTNHLTAMPTLFFMPPDVPPGAYQLVTGLYHAETGQRLIVDETQQDSTLVSIITINP